LESIDQDSVFLVIWLVLSVFMGVFLRKKPKFKGGSAFSSCCSWWFWSRNKTTGL